MPTVVKEIEPVREETLTTTVKPSTTTTLATKPMTTTVATTKPLLISEPVSVSPVEAESSPSSSAPTFFGGGGGGGGAMVMEEEEMVGEEKMASTEANNGLDEKGRSKTKKYLIIGLIGLAVLIATYFIYKKIKKK